MSDDVSNPISQSGSVTPGHPAVWVTSGVVQDAGSASNGILSGVGIQSASGTAVGIKTAPSNQPFSIFGLGFSVSSGNAQITLTSYNGDPIRALEYVINGTTYPFPGPGGGDVFGPLSAVNGHLASFNGVSGTIIQDSGIAAASVVLNNAGTYNINISGTATSAANATNAASVPWSGVTGKPYIPNQSVDTTATPTFAGLTLSSLPTSNSGLPAGTLWNNGGVVCIA